MSRTVHFAIPGNLDTLTGGYAYDRRMIRELRALGWNVPVATLSSRFPVPGPVALRATQVTIAGIPDGAWVLADGLAFGAMSEIVAAEARRLRWVALVHHPLALETGLTPAEVQRLWETEARALAAAQLVIATSVTTRRSLELDYGVPADRLLVVPPGTDPATPRVAHLGPLRILSVGAITPRKGHDVLVAALAAIRDLDWTCRIVGDDTRDTATAERLRAAIRDAGLADRIILTGAVDDTASEYAAADLFALASRHEGYGMAFAEALAHGLPVVACAAGAVPEVVPLAAGRLVPPDDVVAFADALRDLVADGELRERCASVAARAGASLPDWAGSARLLAAALEGLET